MHHISADTRKRF